ncbi:MAG: GntR family transcriptional regulator [Halanaerobacter sp.]
MGLEELTKKEQIINFARHDPFLKINDIAENVDTTPRYVRTILSEANISLMELREKYARNMEQRLAGDRSDFQQATIKLLEKDKDFEAGEINIKEIDNLEFNDLVKTKADEELYKIVQEKLVESQVCGWQEIITYLSSGINGERLANLNSLYELFGDKGINNLKFRNNVIQVEEANPVLEERLDFRGEYNLVMKSQRIILIDKMPIGIENYYFDANSIQLVFPGELVV